MIKGAFVFFVHTHVREDIFALYGFASDPDRTAFRSLLGVSNVGPKTALAVLSALPGHDLARAIARKDLKALTAISGIGKKTAEMMLLQLRDKLPEGGASPADATSAGASKSPSRPGELLANALTGLGYRASDAERALVALRDKLDHTPLQELLREALAMLAK